MMKKDEKRLIDHLRELDREQDSTDPRWSALVHGSLSEDEVEALRRESPEEFEIFRPLDPERRDDIIERVLRGARPQPIEPSLFERLQNGIAAWKRRSALIFASVATAAAAAGALFLIPPRVPAVGQWDGIYEGGQFAELGTPSPNDKPEFHVVLGEGRLILRLRPEEPVDYKPNYRCELEPAEGDGPPVTFNPSVQAKLHPHGTVKIEGTRAELFPGLSEGTWKFICAVGPRELPKERLSTLPPKSEKQDYAILTFDKLIRLKPRSGAPR